MKTTLTEQEGNVVRLDIEVPGEEVQRGYDETVARLSRQVNVPGFRKGKVPASLVVQRFGKEALIHQMLEDFLSDWYLEGLKESGISPVDRPQVDFDEGPEPGRAFRFHAEVEVMPEVELGEYKGLEVPYEEPEVADEEVDREIERLQEEFAELKPVSGRPVQEGDHATVDFSGTVEGEPVDELEAEDYLVEVGSDELLPELNEALVGMEQDEERQVTVDFPDDHPAEQLAGKQVEFTVVVKDVKEKELPPPNDEFAKDVSEFETLLELRGDIRRKLASSKESAARRGFRAAAVQAATERADIAVPDALVEQEAERMIDDFARSLEMRGGDLDGYLEMTGTSREKMREDVKPQAEYNLKSGMVLDAIVEKEGLEASAEEIEEAVGEAAAANKVEPSELRAHLEESGRIGAVEQNIVREKAAELIEEHAEKVAPPAEGTEKEDTEEVAGGAGDGNEADNEGTEV